MTVNISQTLANSIKKTGKQYYLRDKRKPYFAIRVSRAGTGTYVFRYKNNGCWHDKGLGYTKDIDCKAAELAADKKNLELIGNYKVEERSEVGTSLPSAIEQHLRLQCIKKYKVPYYTELNERRKHWPKYLYDKSLGLAKVVNFFGPDTLMEDISHDDIEDYHLFVTENAPVLANRHIAYLSTIFNELVRKEKLPRNPCKLLERNVETPQKQPLPDEAIPLFYELLDQEKNQVVADAIRFAFLSGCRISEILSLRSNQFARDNYVNWEEGYVYFFAHKTARRSKKDLGKRWLHDKALDILKRHKKRRGIRQKVFVNANGKPVTYQQYKNMFNRVRSKLFQGEEYKNITAYCARHTFAQTCADDLMDRDALKNLMGLASTRMLSEHYATREDALAKHAVKVAFQSKSNLFAKV